MNNIFEDTKVLDLLENCLSNYSYDIAKLVYYLYNKVRSDTLRFVKKILKDKY